MFYEQWPIFLLVIVDILGRVDTNTFIDTAVNRVYDTILKQFFHRFVVIT